MTKEMLLEVKEKVANTLAGCDQVQFVMESVNNSGKTVLTIKLKDKDVANVCPNFSNSLNDCASCDFGGGWHLVDGRCVPQKDVEVALDYSNLPLDVRYRLAATKQRKIRNDRKVERIEKEVSGAVWV